MTHSFDKDYWEQHWAQAPGTTGDLSTDPSPYVLEAVLGLRPASALDAGCGNGTDAIWLAGRGWHATGADISGRALATAAERARRASVDTRVEWVETDLTAWEPEARWDLVMTNYAHPALPQLAFYARIAEWVAPGGTLLIVGHRHDESMDGHRHEAAPPEEATVTASAVTALLSPAVWRIDAAEEHVRSLPGSAPRPALHDVVVRATRVA